MYNRNAVFFKLLIATTSFFASVCQGGRVTKVTPSTGSIMGATRLTIQGEGFATNQFNYYQPELGNNVTLLSISRAHIVPCDVIPYYTTPYQIVCDTRPSQSGEDSFNIRVQVDGKLLDNSNGDTYCGHECTYKYSKDRSPAIESITPRYGLPGTLLTIRGKLFTAQVMETEEFDSQKSIVERVYAGAGLCEVRNPETEELYGIALEDAQSGFIKCKPSSLLIDSQRASFLVSDYGRSLMSKDALMVDAQDKLYLFQTHADVLEVSPSMGGMAGGTLLTIKARLFENNPKSLAVHVGGVPCMILSHDKDVITCKTGEAPPSLPDANDSYPGARGMLREVWTRTKPSTVSAVGSLKTTAPDYHSEIAPEAHSPTEATFNESTSFSSRLRGYFVPPSDNNYTFFIQADDKAELYFSLSPSAAAKSKIATCSGPTTSWSAFPEQRSAVFPLKRGQQYYIEALHVQESGKSHVAIGVKMQKTRYVNSQVASAVNEKQEIRISSEKHPEKQVITVSSWDDGQKFEIQEVEVARCHQQQENTSICGEMLSLSYGDKDSSPLSLNNMTATDLQQALNNLTTIKKQGHVNVTNIWRDNSTVYRVTFYFTNPEDTQMLRNRSEVSAAASVKITCTQKGVNGNYWFKLSLAGRISDDIHVNGSASDVKQQLENMIGWQCSYQTPSERAYYYNGFESPPQGSEWGERVLVMRPYCGRSSLMNPQFIFVAGQTKDLWGRVLTGYDVSKYKQLCFAYKGMYKDYLTFQISYTDKSSVGRRSWRKYNFVPFRDNKWHQQCMNVEDQVLNDAYLNSKADTRYKLYVDSIRAAWDTGTDVYIDDVFIWRDAVLVQQVLPAAEPNGHIIEFVDVKSLGPSAWSVSITPASCGTGIELLQIADAKVISGNITSREVTFSPFNATGNTSIRVSRDQAATPSIGGTFGLSLENKLLKGIPANVSAEDLMSLLETKFNIGKVSVSRTGTCAGYNWTVVWDTTGGDQPTLVANETGLTGNKVSITAVTIEDGGMFLRPIPGDMLRVAELKPQVTVTVNGIPSSCFQRNCSFTYSPFVTASLTSIYPRKGRSGTQVTLTGNGFGSAIQEVLVTIGGVECHVTSCSATTMKCTVGQSAGGVHDVVVTVANGQARHSVEKVTFSYLISVNSVIPVRGSLGGGTAVTIKGDGFGVTSNETNVTIGGLPCDVLNASVTELVCVTSSHAPATVSVEVAVGEEMGSLSNIYRYDVTMTPTITSISSSEGSVGGGEQLVIQGTGFGFTQGTIKIGSSPCKVITYSDVFIKCTTPAKKPGIYDLLIVVEGKGYAVLASKPPQFEYVLKVIDVYPRYGSIFGGTILTITGRGFSDNSSTTAVTIGNESCEILSSRKTEIKCKTGASSETYRVDNSGIHPEFGVGYAWNPQTVIINAGDYVQWKWVSPELSGLMFGVEQIHDSGSTVYDGKGFKSSRSSNGNFTMRFDIPGTYYYASGEVDPFGAIIMKGQVVVNDMKSKVFDVKVQIGEVVAENNISRSSPTHSGSSDCQNGVTSPISQCSSIDLLPDNTPSTGFTFSTCSTPEVTSINPNTGTGSTILTITGRGFGSQDCQNEVRVGSRGCIIQTSSQDTITCLVSTGNELSAGVKHGVLLRVNNRGLAAVKIADKRNSTFTLQPTIRSITPRTGSVMGGSIITITGDGFSTNQDSKVLIGESPCHVLSISYTQIQCQTRANNFSRPLLLSVTVNGMESLCVAGLGCTFRFLTEQTPRVDSVTPSAIVGADNTIRIYGSGLPSKPSDLNIEIGNTSCVVTSSSQFSARCRVGAVVAGKHTVRVWVSSKGFAMFEAGESGVIDSLAIVSSITPTEGSIMGGTELSIKGSGFDPITGHTTVKIGTNYCSVVHVTSSEVVCKTLAHSPGSFEVLVAANDEDFPRLRYAYRTFITPYVTSVSPSRGKGGQTITIFGSGFSKDPVNTRVNIDNTSCNVLTSTDTKVTCVLGDHSAGLYDVILHVKGRGLAGYTSATVRFLYEISLTSIWPNDSGLGGGRVISVKGHGFDSSLVVKICDNICVTLNSTLTELYCDIPAYTGITATSDTACSVSVEGDADVMTTKPALFTYRESLTSRITSVTPTRGGTGGGVQVTIKGSGFRSFADQNRVTIGGVTCQITSYSTTEIRCTTGSRKGTIRTKVRVEVGNQGIATQDHADFQYIDVWSSPFSWGYKSPPTAGDMVIIPKGQTMLLDVDTPVFAALVIKGELIFDEKDLTLNAKKILVVDGGKLEVGTEAKPFQHRAKIVLHGHQLNTRLPIFGTKVLAVREGTLDLHGKVISVTWTHLAQTASPGDTQLTLKHAVTWQVGDKIVLASTSRSPRENEELNITSVSSNGQIISVAPPLKYRHISIVQNIEGRTVETRAEVGILTRNVVVEGSENDEWTEKIEECPEGFNPGLFAVQTCFQGRYGSNMGSEQFGSQIMINARKKSEGLVTGRISYVEVRKAGQAFGLGRYPIHFHLSGDVTGSYVRGCAIHHTFNRAVTVHGVTGLLVEHNVAYHVMGHAFFIEDGIETGNTIQYNLGVFVQTSSTLLVTDATPATFWVTNPNNTIRHNSAAGGSHHGYWYNLPTHPGGPSFTTSVCPQNAPLGEFQNNSAHSFGRYGVWIFQDYFPMSGGECDSAISEPAKFYSLLAYNNLKGFELTNGGAIQTINFTVLDNKEAGLEFTKVEAPWGDKGPLIKDSLVVGHSAVSGQSSACTQGGLVAPGSSRLTVSGTTFVNFDVASCVALRACSFCKEKQGGFTTRFEKTRFVNAPNKAAFKWEHEGVFQDLDGSLTGISGGGSLVPSNPNLPPEHCSQSPTASFGSVSGSMCDANVRFRRMAWNKPLPSSLLYRNALLTNKYGTSRVPWRFMRLTHNQGWMATVILGQNYNFTFENAPQLTNISYSGTFYEFGDQDSLWMTHPLKQIPDMMSTTGTFVNMTSGIPSPGNASNGDWYFNNRTKELTYIVSGRRGRGLSDRDIQLQVYRCFFKNCIKPIPPPPPEKRPIEYLRWSDAESWYGTEPGYGGYNKRLPKDGEDVIIQQHWWMVADIELPAMRKLFIYGTLELEPHMDFVLNATYIVVGLGGNLIIGWEDQPMIGNVLVILNGNWDTPDMPIQDGPNVGAKAIGVFGNLEIHGLNRSVYWTRLSKTADPGSSIIHLAAAVDWRPGEEIVIAPTNFEPYDTEVFKIVNVYPDGKSLQMNGTLKFKHVAEHYHTGNWNYTLAAEVGLLTRNIVIEGADDANQVLDKQSFGCRVLIGSVGGTDKPYSRRVRVENAEFRFCGQEGWSDEFDPRYSLALLDVGTLKSSYIRGNSFHDGFNTAIGVFGTNELTVIDNVVHHTVGSSVRVSGTDNKVMKNLVVLSVSPATYKGRHEDHNQLWHAAFDVSKASRITLRENAAAGSERIGFHIRGEECYQDNSKERWDGNVAHTTLHGIHIGYGDGLPGCLEINNFLIWKNWDYGVFGYPASRVIVQNTVIADNNIGILVNVWNPPALSHKTADKFVHLNNVLIIGTSPSFDCAVDLLVPRNSDITNIVRAPRFKEGGNTGLMLTTFCSAPGLAPEMPWHEVIAYPAIRGIMRLSNVGFAHFGSKCGKQSVVFTTNPSSPDAFHPVELNDVSLYNVDNDRLFYIPPSNIAWINPGDCVDMDCDGAKHVLIRDLHGSVTGVPGGSVTSKAEYEWNGDPRRGLGDYRIPRAMLTGLDGSRLNASVVAPHHGIARGPRTQSLCSWKTAWNAYQCTTLDYHMFVIESMDADTELRRLSPVALSTSGYTDLLNGPMDQGCCFGYSCMERISTFHSIVAVGNNYTIYFTGTNPEKLRLTLLNANSSQVLRVAIRYATPRRLDVYRKGVYLYPTNAKLDGQNFSYKKKDENLPDDQFEPTLASISGANYFDRSSQLLFVVVRGSVAIDIRTAPVIQVKLGSRPVHFNDFFEKNLIQNLAALLNIDQSRIRIVEVVNAAGSSRRRRRQSDDTSMNITIEIGDPPLPHIPYTPDETFVPGNASTTTASPVTITTAPLPTQSPTEHYIGLQSLATKTVEAAQTGSMASVLNLDILSIEVTDPDAPRKLPDGWKRATPADAGPTNGTWRFDQVEMMKERNKSSPVHDYLIPVKLRLMQGPYGANETVPFLVQPKLVMVDKLNRTVSTLGHGSEGQWYLTATIRNGTGDPGAVLGGNASIPFNDGWANFTNLDISHNATDYILEFQITSPIKANFSAQSAPFEVKERILYFTLVSQPGDANETVPFGRPPVVEVRDAANGDLVTNTGWKGRRWICKASIVNPQSHKGNLNGSTVVEFSAGVASLTNLSIDYEDKNYILLIETLTVPQSRYQFSVKTDPFDVKERVLVLVITQQPGNCNDTVPCGFQPIIEIQDSATNIPAGNLGWRGRTWTIQATMAQGTGNDVIQGISRFQIPRSGLAEFTNISFYDVASGYRMKFEVTVDPHSPSYSGMSAISNVFDVNPRQFYLSVVTQVSNANQSIVFGTQPVVEVHDMGTGDRATPLKTSWWIVVSLYTNPKLGQSLLNGTRNVSVVQERAVFTDLLITVYGSGYVLKFQSNHGQNIISAPFEVRYVNDFAPVFVPSSGNYTVSISEAVSIGSFVIMINATDKDEGSQGQVFYALSDGNIGNSFKINQTSGEITTAVKLDRERSATFTIIVRAYDGAVQEKVRSTEGHVFVEILDVNDNAPRFTQNPFVANVNETAGLHDVIIQAKAMDPDAGTNAELRYSIASGNGDGYFDIKPATGEIVVKKTLDLESATPPSLKHSLGIHVTDLGSPTALSNSTTVVINILPVNEFSPQFTHRPSARVSVRENYSTGDGLVLFDVNATDKDFGEQGQVFYSIASGNEQGKFSVNTSTGIVTLVSPLDYETAASYTLIIRTSDFDLSGHARHANFTLLVDVDDVNDNAPEFAQMLSVVNVSETLPIGQTAMTVQASDADSGSNSRVDYYIISGNTAGFFMLDSDTGVLTSRRSLDLESAQILDWNFTLVIVAKDHGKPQLSGNATFVLRIIGVNEFTPQFTGGGMSFHVAEDIDVGTMICHVTATDRDYGPDGQIRFEIAEGNEDKRFRIDSATGKVYIHAPLDRETTPVYHLKITASDSPLQPANQRSSYIFVDFTLTDVNDNKPVFEKGSYYAAVKETAGVGDDVVSVHATDNDAGPNGQVEYRIKSGNSLGLFDINANTGTISVKKSLDLESQQHVDDLLYTLTVEAWDQGKPAPLSNDVLVTMEIKSVNEFSPMLLHSDSLYIKIPEDTPIGSCVADINATDRDFGLDGKMSYSLISGNEDDMFVINRNTGVLIVNGELDYETVVRYSLGIRVHDEAPPDQRRSTVAKVTIRLTNINDSGGVDVLVQDVFGRITFPGDPAEQVGLGTTSPISVTLLYENGKVEKLMPDDKRLSFDDKSESHDLFTVVKTKVQSVISANHAGLLGQGILIVRVHNVYNVRIKITVVGYSFLQLNASPYPSLDQSNPTLTSLKRVGSNHGNFQQAALHLSLVLTDNSTYDVTRMTSTSFQVVNNYPGVEVSIGPRPENLLKADNGSVSGKFSVCGEFSGKSSEELSIGVSSGFITVEEIITVRLTELRNQTLLGPVLTTKAQILVDFRMNDSSILRVQNFSMFSGLVTFTSSHDQAASVDSVTGVVTLLADYHDQVSVTVSALQGPAGAKQVSFYCNTVPPVGGVDIGQEYGPALPRVTVHQRVTIPVRVNPGRSELLAFDIKVLYISSQVRFVKVKGNVAYSHSHEVLHLADVVDPDSANSNLAADLIFESEVDGVLSIQASSIMLIDSRLSFIGNNVSPVTSCVDLPLGDANADCVFDIQDAAYAMAYSLANEKNFKGEFEQTLLRETTEKMKKVMDFNSNGIAERGDAVLLARANLDLVRFIREWRISFPDHRNEPAECALGVTAKLSTRSGDIETLSNTLVFFEFASRQERLKSQLENTTFETGEIINLYNEDEGLWGGIVKAVSSKGVYEILARKPKLEVFNLGLSMIQVTQTPSRTEPVITPLFSYSRDPVYPGGVRVILAPNAELVSDSGHSPQLTIKKTESYDSCQDPWITKTVMLVFGNDFSEVEDSENRFIKLFINDVTSRFPRATVGNARLARGSILVYFDLTTQRSRMDATLLALWDLVKSRFTLQMDSVEFQAQNVMRVDGNDYHGADGKPKTKQDVSSFPVAAVVTVCVVVTLVVIGVVAFFCLKKRVVQQKERHKWKRMSKMDVLESRSISGVSDQSRDTEMVIINGLNREDCDPADIEMTSSPRPQQRNSLGQILNPQENFAKRKLRKVESASSQVSIEAWSESSSPATDRRQSQVKQQIPLVSASPLVSSKCHRKPLPSGKMLTKQKSDSQLLTQEHSSTEGSPLNLTPRIPQRNQAVQKKKLAHQNSVTKLINSDSSDEEFISNVIEGHRTTHASNKKSLSPQTTGSKMVDQEFSLFERAVLHRRLSPRDGGSKQSSRSPSVDSSRTGSGHSTPKFVVSSLPPGYVGNFNHGNDITVEDESYTVRLPVNVMNTLAEGDGGKPFTKLGFIEFPSDSMLSDLRFKLRRDFCTALHGKHFLFQDAFMADVDPPTEDSTSAKTIYNLSVIIRVANSQEANRFFCVCGTIAHFQCSACYKRGYCGRECQLRDWPNHKITCDPEEVSCV